jgi:hypothetical protein
MLACLLACLLAAGSHTWTAARLDDKDILPSHALFNLHPGLPDLELAKEGLCGWDAEVVADGPAPSLALRFVKLLLIAMLKAVGGEAARTQSAVDASSRRARQCCGPWRRLERWWGASKQTPVRKGQGRTGLQRKTSRGVGGARARARAGQVMGLVAVVGAAEGLCQELGSMVDNTSLRCTQTNFSNPSRQRAGGPIPKRRGLRNF